MATTSREVESNRLPLALLVTNSNRRGANRRVSQNKSPNDQILKSQIPSFIPDQVLTFKCRYYVNPAAATDVITFVRELPVVPLAVSYSATSLIQIFKAVRLAKVEMWCNHRDSVGVDGNTINLTAVERRTVRPIEWSDTATQLCPAHIVKKFSPVEPLGLWYGTTSGESNPELRFQMSKGAVLEMTYCAILHDAESITSIAASGLTFVRVYTNNLDTNVLAIGRSYQTSMTF